jgi:hypothetical protein
VNKTHRILTTTGQNAVCLVFASKAAEQAVLMLEIKRTIAALKSVLM